MSLTVKLNRFKVLECKSEKFVRLEFRGFEKYTTIAKSNEELLFIQETFEWPVVQTLLPGEVLTVQLIMRGRFGSPHLMGVYRLGMHILVNDGQLTVTDSLVDDNNKSVPVFIDMDVIYIAPHLLKLKVAATAAAAAEAEGQLVVEVHRRPNSDLPAVHAGRPLHRIIHDPVTDPVPGPSTSRATDSQPETTVAEIEAEMETLEIDEDTKYLDELERNIASAERSIQTQQVVDDVEPIDESRSQRLKNVGKKILRRGLSFGGDKTVKLVESSSPQNRPSTSQGRRTSPLRTMKNLMRFGRARRCDEEQGLLECQPGPSSAPERPFSRSSVNSDEILVDTSADPDFPKMRKIRTTVDAGGASAMKATDFQVCVTIIEARQLAGLNMDPVVCVQVGEIRKYTSVKDSTNCPYYNEYFVFDFHMPPVMLFDKIITLSVLQSRHILRTNKLLGTFKLDVATVWNQPDRQFFHKWALLTDPDDVNAGPKGYLKCDISVIGKGDTIKVPPKSERDEDDIEANLLLPDGMPVERQRARFFVKIYKADGLPKMNYSLLANVKRAFTGESQDLVDPYVEVSFAGMTGCTSVKKNCYSPVWNEQLVFTEMFPPLCQRLKIQLKDDDAVHPGIIGTHFIDLQTISHEGDRGFLPTFGPAYIHMYGSTRDYSLLDQHSNLNTGMGEGVSYRARLLISIRTEIMEIIENPSTDIEIEPVVPINERAFEKHEEFFLFACLFDANMIDKRLTDKPIQFELSIGNAGNVLDGNKESLKRPQDLNVPDLNDLNADIGFWQSVSQPTKAVSTDKNYYFLPYWDLKQCMHVRSIWPDHRRRMYNSNMIFKIIEEFEEGLDNIQNAVETDGGPDSSCVAYMKSVLDSVCTSCINYLDHMTSLPIGGGTKLDRERHKLCISEIEQMSTLTKSLKALVTKNSIKDRIRTAYTYLNRLKHLCEDPQHSMPDVFIWMMSNGKRLAYHRFSARDLIFSQSVEERGKLCGKMQTLFLKWPGKKATSPSGWAIPAKINAFIWLGMLQDKKHFLETLPTGYELTQEVKNADKPRALAPETLFYAEKHNFQMRAYIYQARSLIGSDSSGLSDPFATVVIGDSTATTQVIDETLSPTWDELLVLDDILLYSTIERIKADPPTIVIEIFDQDKVGKSEFIGRTLAKPTVRSLEDIQNGLQHPPILEWHEITRGDDKAGELLATFEILEIAPKGNASILPALPDPKNVVRNQLNEFQKNCKYPVPLGIRPTLSRYRVEVLFWGLRDVKRLHLLTVDRPRVDIECAGNLVYSNVIQNAQRNPNFPYPIKYIDVELPDQDLYRPPLTIRVVDCRSFGRITLVGTHTINSIHKYIYTPMSKREREIEERKKSIIELQNVDLRTNRIIQDDEYAVETERESCPLLVREGRTMTYGSGIKLPTKKKIIPRDVSKKRKGSTDSVLDDDESNKDWWTKYFASVETMIEDEKDNKRERDYLRPPQISYVNEIRSPREEINSPYFDRDRRKQRPSTSPRAKTSPLAVPNKNEIPRSAMTKVYPHELEAVTEYEEFKEWLNSF